MNMNLFVEEVHVVNGLSPAADIYNGNPATDVVNMKNFQKVVFVLHQKTAGSNTGTATVTVEACTSAAGANNEAVPFKYTKKTTGASDVMGSVTAATASGFTTTANEDTVYVIEADPCDFPATKPYCRLQLTESVNDPVTGGVLILLKGARNGYPFATALT